MFSFGKYWSYSSMLELIFHLVMLNCRIENVIFVNFISNHFFLRENDATLL